MSQNPNAIIDSKPGVCPKCGSQDVNFGDVEFCEETWCRQDCDCNDCDCRWAEYFYCTFDHKEICE